MTLDSIRNSCDVLVTYGLKSLCPKVKVSKRGPEEVTNKERRAPAGGEPHPERAEPLLVREEPRPHPQDRGATQNLA